MGEKGTTRRMGMQEMEVGGMKLLALPSIERKKTVERYGGSGRRKMETGRYLADRRQC
jgi:hypothetical protein